MILHDHRMFMNKNFLVYQNILQDRSFNIFSNRQEIIHRQFYIPLFVGIQKLTYFLPLISRYTQLANIVPMIYVLAQASAVYSTSEIFITLIYTKLIN